MTYNIGNESNDSLLIGWCTYQKFYDILLLEANTNDIIVELGAWEGMSAVHIGQSLRESGNPKNIKYYIIDNWEGSLEHEFFERTPHIKERFFRNIAHVKEFINPVTSDSAEAAKMFKDKSIYVCFIDAGHEEDSVTKDINAWYPKIKQHGILAGHDYFSKQFPDVKKVVDNFARINNLNLNTNKSLNIWWFTL